MRLLRQLFGTIFFLLFIPVCLIPLAGATQNNSNNQGTGFEGRVAINGLVLPGSRVYAYATFEDFLNYKPIAVSNLTSDDGKWKLDLPQGRYYLVAKKSSNKNLDGPVGVGDWFAFHGSNPITAVAGRYTHVGFALSKVESSVKYQKYTDKNAGALSGIIKDSDGRPIEGAVISLYLDAKDNFKGIPFAQVHSNKSGQFSFSSLPESSYFVIGRKRANKKTAGPISDGDYFTFFPNNPVKIKSGKLAKITLNAAPKAGEIGKEDSLFRDTGTKISGRLIDKNGNPVSGVYAFAYDDKAMALKRPVAISKETDKSGFYVLYLPEGGVYYIGARSDYGDSPAFGEWYGRYEGTPDHSIKIKSGESIEKIDIVVEKLTP